MRPAFESTTAGNPRPTGDEKALAPMVAAATVWNVARRRSLDDAEVWRPNGPVLDRRRLFPQHQKIRQTVVTWSVGENFVGPTHGLYERLARVGIAERREATGNAITQIIELASGLDNAKGLAPL